MDINEKEIVDRIKLAEYIASNAGSLIKDLYHKNIIVTEKAVNDFVTELDKNIESMALKSVMQAFPDDGFYGEENMSVESRNCYEWVIDPIDGTNNFIRGLPLCGFQLAILYNDKPIYALIHRPLTQEIYTATLGLGAYYKNNFTGTNKKISVSDRSLEESIGIFDSKVGRKQNKSTQIMEKIIEHIASVRVFGVAVFDLPAVAEGSVEFLISGISKKYDIAAGQLLVEEAGGFAFSVTGEDIELHDETVIFCSRKIKDELIKIIQD